MPFNAAQPRATLRLSPSEPLELQSRKRQRYPNNQLSEPRQRSSTRCISKFTYSMLI